MTASTNTTLPGLLRARAAEDAEGALIEEVNGRTLNAAQFDEEARRWAAAYARLGIGRGDRVLVMLPASIDALASWIGLGLLGAIEVAVHTAYRGQALQHVVKDADAKVLVIQHRWLERLDELDPDTLPTSVVVVDATGIHSGGERPCPLLVNRSQFLHTADNSAVDLRLPEPHDVATILYTSGTTGPSKGVLITWEQMRASAAGILPLDDLGPDPAYYCPFPPFHVSGKAPFNTMALVGGRLVLRESFKTDDFWPDVRRYRCTTTNLMDTMAQFLLQAPASAEDADHPLRNVLMVPLIGELERFKQRFGVRVCTVFNMTETSCPIGTEGWNVENPRAAGRVRPGWQARVVDANDNEVPTGEVGELIVRSDAPWRLMAGYWRRPDSTVEAWRNQWFHTGDLFRVDDEGQFTFVDRLKDAIRRRGENISSAELEAYVLAHPSVAECAAVAVPSPWGEDDVKIAVVAADRSDLDPEELMEFLRGSIPRFMVPRYVQVLDELPKTATNKIRKLELRDSTHGRTWDFETPRARAGAPTR